MEAPEASRVHYGERGFLYLYTYIHKKERGRGGGYAWELSSVSMESNLTVGNFVNSEPLHPKALDCMKIHIEKSH